MPDVVELFIYFTVMVFITERNIALKTLVIFINGQ